MHCSTMNNGHHNYTTLILFSLIKIGSLGQCFINLPPTPAPDNQQFTLYFCNFNFLRFHTRVSQSFIAETDSQEKRF